MSFSVSAERFEAGEVRRSMHLSFDLAFRPVETKNDEFHAFYGFLVIVQQVCHQEDVDLYIHRRSHATN